MYDQLLRYENRKKRRKRRKKRARTEREKKKKIPKGGGEASGIRRDMLASMQINNEEEKITPNPKENRKEKKRGNFRTNDIPIGGALVAFVSVPDCSSSELTQFGSYIEQQRFTKIQILEKIVHCVQDQRKQLTSSDSSVSLAGYKFPRCIDEAFPFPEEEPNA